MGLALTQRRRHPLATGLVVLLTWPVAFLLTPVYVLFFGQFVPMAVAVFSMARHGRGRVPFVGAALGAATLLFFDLFVSVLQAPGEIVFHWGVFTIVWGFGFGLQRLERRAEESTRRAVEVEVAAAEQAMAAVVAERTRIAQELHDIVAHSSAPWWCRPGPPSRSWVRTRSSYAARSAPSARPGRTRSGRCAGRWRCCARTRTPAR